MLNLYEKNEKIKSINSCVKKLITTNNPNNEYEIPYSERKVKNKSGDKLQTIDIVTFVV